MAKTLIQKLNDIMGEVDYIQKDKTNAFHKYNYASEQAIKQALHPLLVKHGVLFMLSAVDIIPSTGQSITTVKDGVSTTVVKQDITNVKFGYSFFNVENREDVFNGSFIGSGQDAGDKGVYKAITGAIKYIMTSTFLIPTGDDPEVEGEVVQREVKRIPIVDVIAPDSNGPVAIKVATPTIYVCSVCDEVITKAEYEYSNKLYKKALCRKHQAEMRNAKV